MAAVPFYHKAAGRQPHGAPEHKERLVDPLGLWDLLGVPHEIWGPEQQVHVPPRLVRIHGSRPPCPRPRGRAWTAREIVKSRR